MDIIWAVFVCMGVPSAVFGFAIWKLKKSIEKREDKREAAEKARQKNEVLLIRGMGAAIALGEATACAIRDGKCNGEMTTALEYARQVKHEQKDFMTEMGVSALN